MGDNTDLIKFIKNDDFVKNNIKLDLSANVRGSANKKKHITFATAIKHICANAASDSTVGDGPSSIRRLVEPLSPPLSSDSNLGFFLLPCALAVSYLAHRFLCRRRPKPVHLLPPPSGLCPN